MMSWVYDLPIWLASIVYIGGMSALAAAGVLLVRRGVAHRAITHNDVAGPIMATLGTVLAVMLSFMVVTMWQEYDNASSFVAQEASDIADLYHESAIFPEPIRGEVQAALRHYVALVIRDEWPRMRDGRESAATRLAAIRAVTLVQQYQPTTLGQQTAQADALAHAHGFLDARRQRLFANSESVPRLLWAMMIFISIVTLGSAYFFRVDNPRAHLLMTVALAAVIGAIFVLIAELDLPFRGPMQIAPSAFAKDYTAFSDTLP
ncbi:MAG: DUF4239 domain-containing protein [bacterium]|nr:DUF4239 domain-containing protein [bacterium]